MRINGISIDGLMKEVKEHLNNAEVLRGEIEKFLDDGYPFGIQNKEKTKILFVLYRINGRTFVDFNIKKDNNFDMVFSNKEKLESNIENLKNLKYVFEYFE